MITQGSVKFLVDVAQSEITKSALVLTSQDMWGRVILHLKHGIMKRQNKQAVPYLIRAIIITRGNYETQTAVTDYRL